MYNRNHNSDRGGDSGLGVGESSSRGQYLPGNAGGQPINNPWVVSRASRSAAAPIPRNHPPKIRRPASNGHLLRDRQTVTIAGESGTLPVVARETGTLATASPVVSWRPLIRREQRQGWGGPENPLEGVGVPPLFYLQ